MPNIYQKNFLKIALPTLEGINFEKIADINYLEADSNYTKIHFLDKRQLLVCKTLKEVEKILNNNRQFVRVHRSHTINLNHLCKYIKGKGGHVVMENGAEIGVSTGRKQDFMAALRWFFN